jgi:hypothetical protein
VNKAIPEWHGRDRLQKVAWVSSQIFPHSVRNARGSSTKIRPTISILLADILSNNLFNVFFIQEWALNYPHFVVARSFGAMIESNEANLRATVFQCIPNRSAIPIRAVINHQNYG